MDSDDEELGLMTERKGKRIATPHLLIVRLKSTGKCHVPLSSVMLFFFASCGITGIIASFLMGNFYRCKTDLFLSMLLTGFELLTEIAKWRSPLGRLLSQHDTRGFVFLVHSMAHWSLFEQSWSSFTLFTAFPMTALSFVCFVCSFLQVLS